MARLAKILARPSDDIKRTSKSPQNSNPAAPTTIPPMAKPRGFLRKPNRLKISPGIRKMPVKIPIIEKIKPIIPKVLVPPCGGRLMNCGADATVVEVAAQRGQTTEAPAGGGGPLVAKSFPQREHVAMLLLPKIAPVRLSDHRPKIKATQKSYISEVIITA